MVKIYFLTDWLFTSIMSYVIIVVIVYKDHHRHHFDKRFAIMTEEKNSSI